jgi:hypothetical protein
MRPMTLAYLDAYDALAARRVPEESLLEEIGS